jgi:hypothetical protein
MQIETVRHRGYHAKPSKKSHKYLSPDYCFPTTLQQQQQSILVPSNPQEPKHKKSKQKKKDGKEKTEKGKRRASKIKFPTTRVKQKTSGSPQIGIVTDSRNGCTRAYVYP